MAYLLEQIVRKVSKAIRDFEMINDKSGIMVGLSGGKDSTALLFVLHEFLHRSKFKYPLAAGHVDMGWNCDLGPLKEFCHSLDIPFFIESTNIGPVVFDVRKEKNPCSLCAKMRRGALNSLAKKHGFSKVALAHHLDDAVETVMLKMFFEGRMESFLPLTYLDRSDLTVIRPLVYVPEQDIARLTRTHELPVITNTCPANGWTMRQEMKNIVRLIEKKNPLAKERALTALKNMEGPKSWKTKGEK